MTNIIQGLAFLAAWAIVLMVVLIAIAIVEALWTRLVTQLPERPALVATIAAAFVIIGTAWLIGAVTIPASQIHIATND